MSKVVELKLSSYVGPLYVIEEEGKFHLVVNEPHKDDSAEISKELYDLLVKELGDNKNDQ